MRAAWLIALAACGASHAEVAKAPAPAAPTAHEASRAPASTAPPARSACARAYPPEMVAEPAGSTFPPPGAPALTGPFAGLTFGMSDADARAHAPAVASALLVPHGPEAEWLRVGAGKARVRVEGELGVSMIEIVYPDEKSAAAAVSAWGAPEAPPSRFGWKFWFSPQRHVRAMLMPGEDDKKTRIEMGVYAPLAPRLGRTGDFFSICGHPILGASRGDFATLPASGDRDDRTTTFHLTSSEHSGGFHPMRVTWKDGRVASYVFELEFTYDRTLHERIPRMLESAWGAGKPVKRAVGMLTQACTAYGDAPILLCDESPITAYRVHVGEAP